MNLEDHVGDIIRKARQAADVTAETAARAAGLSAAQLTALEQSGQLGRPVDFAALARAVGLNGPKLEGLAKGWRPAEPDSSRWRGLRQIPTTEGGNTVNCFLVWDKPSPDAALFDTGWNAGPVFGLLDQHQLALKHLFLTHTHHDHVAALEPLRRRFPRLCLHAGSRPVPPAPRDRSDDAIHLGGLRIAQRDVPGHADDGVIYVIDHWPDGAPAVAVVGDTLFAGSLATGFISTDLLKQKVREQILSLPPDTLLCPGHGPVTTVAEEKAQNPFFDF